jgi:hypothetical protein
MFRVGAKQICVEFVLVRFFVGVDLIIYVPNSNASIASVNVDRRHGGSGGRLEESRDFTPAPVFSPYYGPEESRCLKAKASIEAWRPTRHV